MASFVLVHGAWHGSWCWKRVRKALERAGHDVYTPTLTGVGERSHLISREVDLETHVQDVLNLIKWEELTDIVLCGHSYRLRAGDAARQPEAVIDRHGDAFGDVLSSTSGRLSAPAQNASVVKAIAPPGVGATLIVVPDPCRPYSTFRAKGAFAVSAGACGRLPSPASGALNQNGGAPHSV